MKRLTPGVMWPRAERVAPRPATDGTTSLYLVLMRASPGTRRPAGLRPPAGGRIEPSRRSYRGSPP
ncbi:MAG: hypothetical protein HXX10_22505 [Rhodoplanes sp.]|uniref:hypothetical protein n=1 Tax=Rhodoplanes sp. TaxID=1968906 RepID=UPI001832CAD0|nr:hypothetical protein [Rhodoplanes sp.]NVO16806.1 hypothetical protein [Rhodoplanes sp.]